MKRRDIKFTERGDSCRTIPEELAEIERLKEQKKAIDELKGLKKIEKLMEVLNTGTRDSEIIHLFKQLLKELEDYIAPPPKSIFGKYKWII